MILFFNDFNFYLIAFPIDWGHIITASILLAVLIILRTLLDFRIAIFIVKKFHFVPVRTLFREKPANISGNWKQVWSIRDTDNFSEFDERYSSISIRQFGRYCYGEFHSKGVTYSVFGKVNQGFFMGEWFDKEDEMGYFGTFELVIIDKNNMQGKWIGHSKTTTSVKGDNWVWNR